MEERQAPERRQTATPEQRKQERALGLAIWLDTLLIVPYCVVAISVGSLAMMAEILRGLPLMIVFAFSLRTLRRIHRGQTSAYEYGVGKVERSLSASAAAFLLFGVLFVTLKALTMKPAVPPAHFM